MKPSKKGQMIGGAIGLLIGSAAAFSIWGVEPPGGLLILFCFSICGLIGWNLGRKREGR